MSMPLAIFHLQRHEQSPESSNGEDKLFGERKDQSGTHLTLAAAGWDKATSRGGQP